MFELRKVTKTVRTAVNRVKIRRQNLRNDSRWIVVFLQLKSSVATQNGKIDLMPKYANDGKAASIKWIKTVKCVTPWVSSLCLQQLRLASTCTAWMLTVLWSRPVVPFILIGSRHKIANGCNYDRGPTKLCRDTVSWLTNALCCRFVEFVVHHKALSYFWWECTVKVGFLANN